MGGVIKLLWVELKVLSPKYFQNIHNNFVAYFIFPVIDIFKIFNNGFHRKYFFLIIIFL